MRILDVFVLWGPRVMADTALLRTLTQVIHLQSPSKSVLVGKTFWVMNQCVDHLSHKEVFEVIDRPLLDLRSEIIKGPRYNRYDAERKVFLSHSLEILRQIVCKIYSEESVRDF